MRSTMHERNEAITQAVVLHRRTRQLLEMPGTGLPLQQCQVGQDTDVITCPHALYRLIEGEETSPGSSASGHFQIRVTTLAYPGAMCIVVVDDETELLELVRVVLEDEGYEVRPFAHLMPVTQLPERQEQPDLFLIDIMLPEISGMELAKRLDEAGFQETPKIAMSASRERIADAMRSGLFTGAIGKPFEIDHLLGYVALHLTT